MIDTDTRFGHLLEPIRDLAQNWSIDIANELEEYLSELESITIQFEDSRTLNFAEAALLIQGSACIYSKKVEHLYTLVYQTLNQVVEKKRIAKEASSMDADQLDAHTELEAAADEEAFLTLEDALKEVDAKSITLSSAASARVASSATRKRAPLSLMRQDGGEAECKMHTCLVHPSGALLLPNVKFPEHLLAAVGGEGGGYLTAPLPGEPLHASSDVEASAFENDSDDGNGDAMYDDGDGWEEELLPPPPEGGASQSEGVAACMSPVALPAGSPAARQASSEEQQAPIQPVRAPTFDPWAPLDPHDPSGALRRPFRKGKTYRAPDPSVLALVAIPGELGLGESRQAVEDADGCVDKENAGADGGERAEALRKSELHPLQQLHLLPVSQADGIVVPLKQPLWAQFETLHAAEARRRAGERKQQRLHAAKREHVPFGGTGADAVEVEVDALVANGAIGEGGGAELYDDDDDNEAPMGFDDGDDNDDALVAATDGGALVTAAGASSYEELCREHIESCLQERTPPGAKLPF